MKKIKKYKLPIGILCVVLVIFILLQSCSSEHWWFGYTYETDGYTNKSATIVKINYPSEKVVIPSTIFFHKVNALGGYRLGEKELRRAGMDYWDQLDVTRYADYEEFLEKNPGAKIYMATTKGPRAYTEVHFEPDCYLMFGKESAGIPG